MTTPEENKAIVRRYQEAYNTNNLDDLDPVVAADIKTPAMLPGFPHGLQGIKQLHRMTVDAWPDAHVTIEDLIAEGDRVAARITVSATPQKEAFGVPPTGKSFKIGGMYIVRIANGKIVETWANMDFMGVLQQVGLIPAQPGK